MRWKKNRCWCRIDEVARTVDSHEYRIETGSNDNTNAQQQPIIPPLHCSQIATQKVLCIVLRKKVKEEF